MEFEENSVRVRAHEMKLDAGRREDCVRCVRCLKYYGMYISFCVRASDDSSCAWQTRQRQFSYYDAFYTVHNSAQCTHSAQPHTRICYASENILLYCALNTHLGWHSFSVHTTHSHTPYRMGLYACASSLDKHIFFNLMHTNNI